MREHADRERMQEFVRELGRSTSSAGTLYLVGGATAVLEGWRASTIDIDVRLEPEADDVLRRISELKEVLDINVELASPPDFIPELPGWRDRSTFIAREGGLDIIKADRACELFAQIEPELYRYPAIDPPAFREAVERTFHC